MSTFVLAVILGVFLGLLPGFLYEFLPKKQRQRIEAWLNKKD